jgi:hypothetical protein
MCDLSNLSTSVPFLAANSFFVSGDINITCGAATFSLTQFQALGYDLFTQEYPPATLAQIVEWGQELFGLGDYADHAQEQVSAYVALF